MSNLQIRFIANTSETRQKGLMHASPLAENEVVLFVFPNSERHAFWNKNVSFPLSLAFLDENGQVVDTKDMEADSMTKVEPGAEAKYVVEAKKGTWDRLAVKNGDIIVYTNHALQVKKG